MIQSDKQTVSLKRLARIAGIFYAILIIGGLFSEIYVSQHIIVWEDAAVTAKNILKYNSLFTFGFISGLIVFLSDIVVALILYTLLKPVNRHLALIATVFRLLMVVISIVGLIHFYSPLLLLKNTEFITTFSSGQLNSIVMLFLEIHSFGSLIALTFHGLHCAILGYLLFKSDYFPKFLGILMLTASAGYLTNSMLNFAPKDLSINYMFLLFPAFIAALSLCLWLLIRGIKTNGHYDIENK